MHAAENADIRMMGYLKCLAGTHLGRLLPLWQGMALCVQLADGSRSVPLQCLVGDDDPRIPAPEVVMRELPCMKASRAGRS